MSIRAEYSEITTKNRINKFSKIKIYDVFKQVNQSNIDVDVFR